MLFVCAWISLLLTRMNLLNAISFSVVFLYLVPIVLFLYTQNLQDILGLVGLVGTTGLSEFLKHYVIKEESPRPSGATDCNLLCNDGNQEGRPGMPSSHSAEVAFFAGYYWDQVRHPILQVALVVYAVLVMTSRYLKRCHTLEQIGAGTLLGLTLSALLKQCVN
jgi:membrane-associated phospholipid phosphatase